MPKLFILLDASDKIVAVFTDEKRAISYFTREDFMGGSYAELDDSTFTLTTILGNHDVILEKAAIEALVTGFQ